MKMRRIYIIKNYNLFRKIDLKINVQDDKLRIITGMKILVKFSNDNIVLRNYLQFSCTYLCQNSYVMSKD